MSRFLIMLVCTVIAGIVATGCTKDKEKSPTTDSSPPPAVDYDNQKFLANVKKQAKAAGCTVEVDEDTGSGHIGEANHLTLDHDPYSTDPPTSGPHFGIVASWGLYDETVPDEYVVHNLEHGGIAIWYGGKYDAKPSDGAQAYASSLIKQGNKIVAAPRTGYADNEFSLAAWRVLVHCPATNTLSLSKGTKLVKAFFEDVGSTGSERESQIPAIVAGTRESFIGSNDPANPMVALPVPPKPVKDISEET